MDRNRNINLRKNKSKLGSPVHTTTKIGEAVEMKMEVPVQELMVRWPGTKVKAGGGARRIDGGGQRLTSGC